MNTVAHINAESHLHGLDMSHAMTGSQKTSIRAPWRVGNVVVGRGNAGWTTSKSGHPCVFQNRSQGTSCRKDWKRISAEWSLVSPWWPNRSRDWTDYSSCGNSVALGMVSCGLLPPTSKDFSPCKYLGMVSLVDVTPCQNVFWDNLAINRSDNKLSGKWSAGTFAWQWREGLARSSVLLPFLKMIIHILREGVCGFILRRKRCKGSHTVILFSEPVIHFFFCSWNKWSMSSRVMGVVWWSGGWVMHVCWCA